MRPSRLRGKAKQSVWAEKGSNSPTSELQKAVCGWGGAQVQALLGAISDSNNRMPDARGAKGAMVDSVREIRVRWAPAQLIC